MTIRDDRRPIEGTLEERLRRLEEEDLPRLEREAAETEDAGVQAFLLSARRERDEIRDALSRARASSDDPWDEQRIEVGDVVEVRDDATGETERYVIVWSGAGVRIEDGWISDRSPLGAALVGSRRGDGVVVDAPAGRLRYTIVDFERAA